MAIKIGGIVLTVGEKIRAVRKERKMTQKRLGNILGMDTTRISQYETGQRNPKIETLSKIADALGVSVAELLPDEMQFTKGPVQKKFNNSIMNRFLEVK